MIGKALSLQLQNECKKLVCIDIKDGDSVYGIQHNLSDLSRSNYLFTRILSFIPRIDTWINCHYPKNFKDWNNKPNDLSEETFINAFREHAFTYYEYGRLVAERMVASSIQGSIIHFSSIFGTISPSFAIYDETPKSLSFAYPAIKGAITNLTRSQAVYYGPKGVRVNSISPGAIQSSQPDKIKNYYIESTPLRRMALPEDITGTVVFLASDSSRFVTGQDLIIDGGYSIK